MTQPDVSVNPRPSRSRTVVLAGITTPKEGYVARQLPTINSLAATRRGLALSAALEVSSPRPQPEGVDSGLLKQIHTLLTRTVRYA